MFPMNTPLGGSFFFLARLLDLPFLGLSPVSRLGGGSEGWAGPQAPAPDPAASRGRGALWTPQ